MKHYIETKQNDYGNWQFRVYHWSGNGQREIYDYKSAFEFSSRENAIDAASEYCESNALDAETEF